MSRSLRRMSLVLACTLALPAAVAAAGPDPDRHIVKFRQGARGNGVAALHAAGASVVLELGPQGAVAARIPAAALAGLRNNPNIEYIEQDAPRYPMAETVPYGIPMVQADQVAWGGVAGARKVCIIDSGYQMSHEDLQTAGVTSYTNSGTGDPLTDRCGHGTHVAGTIAALGNNGVGVVGVNPSGAINLHIVKVFGDDCSWTYSSNLVDASNRCAAAGANVISMSLGCSGNFCRSTTEENAFNTHWNNGILSIAAAGNDGTTKMSYPASYGSVVSVAAIDSNKAVASFSQKNSAVEIAAPGVAVLSTVPWLDRNTLGAGSTTWSGGRIDGAARTSLSGVSGGIVDGGKCTAAGAWAGKVVLCQRGDVSFADKVNAVKSGGGVAAAIYNNAASDPTCGVFAGTLGDGVTSTLPAISMSCADGAAALGGVGTTGTVVSVYDVNGSGYEAWDGTSMATPHVAGVAALVWSHNPAWTNAQVRDAMQKTAEDLGAAGRDSSYGFGLVRAKAALCYLDPNNSACGTGGGGGGGNAAPTASFTYSCTNLSCSFDGSGSSDSDGTIAGYSWAFGDSTSASGVTASRTYAAAGTYTVTLTVTDDAGATGSTSQTVTVTASPTGGGITLSATGTKVKGVQQADLTWSGATSASVDVYRDNVRVTTTANDGAHTDNINRKGSGSYVYRVCEAGTATCSNNVTVAF